MRCPPPGTRRAAARQPSSSQTESLPSSQALESAQHRQCKLIIERAMHPGRMSLSADRAECACLRIVKLEDQQQLRVAQIYCIFRFARHLWQYGRQRRCERALATGLQIQAKLCCSVNPHCRPCFNHSRTGTEGAVFSARARPQPLRRRVHARDVSAHLLEL